MLQLHSTNIIELTGRTQESFTNVFLKNSTLSCQSEKIEPHILVSQFPWQPFLGPFPPRCGILTLQWRSLLSFYTVTHQYWVWYLHSPVEISSLFLCYYPPITDLGVIFIFYMGLLLAQIFKNFILVSLGLSFKKKIYCVLGLLVTQ